MATVSFNEEPQYKLPQQTSTKPFLVRMVLATRIVNTDRQAEYALVGVAIVAIIMAVWFWPDGRSAPAGAENLPIAGPSRGAQ